jgi:hypothetical protein
VHTLADRLRIELRMTQRDQQPLDAAAPAWRGQAAFRETQRLGAALPLFGGVHDATRFDGSQFN